MKRLLLGLLLGTLCVGQAFAATEVKMAGDARIHGTFLSKRNYTGWNETGTKTGDAFAIWERFRLRTDFIANEALKFRLGLRVNNKAWGNDTFTVDNPAVSIDVYQAYLQFKWPQTDVEFTIGLQDFDLPMSSLSFFNANPVYGGSRAAAALVSAPITDQVKVVGGFSRLLDNNRDFDPTTKQVPDELDAYFLSIPITLNGFQATPWGLLAVAGRNVDYAGASVGNAGASVASNLLSPAAAMAPERSRNGQNLYWWAGGAFSLTALDPLLFYADIMYGEGNAADRAKNRRAGLFLDAGVEYTGLDALTPQLAFWYATGEDGSMRNGSERMPSLMGYWGPGNSFLFDSSQDITRGSMILNPLGSWGLMASLDKVSFVNDLKHRLTFAYARGTNAPKALRSANTLWGTANYVQMGRDLSTNEYVLAANIENYYNIYENLILMVEAGWSHGQFEKSIWGRRFVNEAQSGDAFMATFGLQYKF